MQIFAKRRGRNITIENNVKLSLQCSPLNLGYGSSPSFYQGNPKEMTAI